MANFKNPIKLIKEKLNLFKLIKSLPNNHLKFNIIFRNYLNSKRYR